MKRFNSASGQSESKETFGGLQLKRIAHKLPCDFDNFTTNVDVMLKVYELLDLRDQLQLCMVSDQLKWIFETFVWKRSYKTLTIHGFAHNFVVTNEILMDRVCLSDDEYQLFIRVFAGDVRSLVSNYDATPDLRLFHNLTKLDYNFTRSFTKEHLRAVAENCRQLEELSLRCCGTRYLNFIDLEDVLDVNILQQFAKLRVLLVLDRYEDKIRYKHFLDIVTKTKLEMLNLGACIIPDESVAAPDAIISLKELQIIIPLDANRWPLNYTPFLSNLENLTSLSLCFNDMVTDKILEVIANTCQQLKTFRVTTSVFRVVKSFALPFSVTELYFDDCEGMTFENLIQLLTQFQIKIFSSLKTQYCGIFKYFQISPHIESLNLDGIYTHLFPSAYTNNVNLKELTWYDTKDSPTDSDMLLRVQIGTCINLQSLTLTSGFMPLSPLMHLKCLRKLSMPHSMPFLNWRYIVIVLKHPALEELKIGDGSPPRWVTKSTHIPAKGFGTNIRRLSISLRVFLSALEFWLDLFNCNSEMTLTCSDFEMNEKIIRHIVMHERFPRYLRTINITGFKINSQDLRNNFDRIMGKFLYDSNFLKITTKNYHSITLCRQAASTSPILVTKKEM